LIAADGEDDDEDVSEVSVLALIKASPGNVSLESMMTEIGKLQVSARRVSQTQLHRLP